MAETRKWTLKPDAGIPEGPSASGSFVEGSSFVDRIIAVTSGVHRADPARPSLERYLNLSGDSGVTGYELGADFIRVRFRGGVTYRYGRVSPGQHLGRMKACAVAGRGLGTYISQNVRNLYENKE